MENVIKGQVYVLGDHIDTDQIIPAEYLVYSLSDPEEARQYGRFALAGVPVEKAGLPDGHRPFVPEGEFQSPYAIILAGENFGCGSSREHAPFALQQAGVRVVIAQSYARIFYRNAVDGGFVIPLESQDRLVANFRTGEEVVVNLEQQWIIRARDGATFPLKPPGDVLPIIEAGGLFPYARKTGLITSGVNSG